MTVDKCITCGEVIPEGLQICPECMRKSGADEKEIEAAEELRDIANILSITAGTDGNIRVAMESILNIANRLEGRKQSEISAENY